MRLAVLSSSVALALLLAACSAAPTTNPNPKLGKTYPTPDAAPTYPGTAFTTMQVYDLEANVWLDENALLEALDDDAMVFMGEQHETAPVQELELWLLTRMTKRYSDVSLGMEHFQHDEQPIIDKYLAGSISSTDFEATSSPWKNYDIYWKPLVEHMKGAGRPVIGLNVPAEALSALYAKFPTSPLKVFNGWDSSSPFEGSIAPRPIPSWDATYRGYFEPSFDYAAHGQKLGLTYDQAVPYFTDLAVIRDETMGYFSAKAIEGGGRLLVVAGDWHVQTGLATPDRAIRYAANNPKTDLVTTTPKAQLEAMKTKTVAGRKMAHFVFVYQ